MQNMGSFRLIVRRGPQPNQVYELNKDSISLGRDITNDITINDPEVSRHHGRITRTPSGYTLEDLGSTNGTFINGQRLTGSRPLLGGEMIGLGETVTLSYDVSAAIAVSAQPVQPMQPSYVPPIDQQQQPGYSPYAPPPDQSYQPAQAAPNQGQQPGYSPYAPPAGAPPAAPQPVPSFVQAAPGYAPIAPQVTSAPPLNPPGQANTLNGPPSYGPPAVPPYTPGYNGNPPADAPQYGQPNNPYASPAAPIAPVASTPISSSPYPPLPDAPPQNNTMRWILLGCGVLILLCVVFSVAGLFYIDANNLYCKLPIVRNIVGLISSQCVVGQ